MDGWVAKPPGWEDEGKVEIGSPARPLSRAVNVDAILVLAGGLDAEGHVHPWVRARLDLAAQYWSTRPTPILCLGGGTYHKPPHINKAGFVVHESTACADYMLSRGVAPRDIYKEWSSYDTIANAYFAFTNHVLPCGWRHVLVITSDFHMPRAKAIFEWVCPLFRAEVTMDFVASPDRMEEEVCIARREREAASLLNLKSVIARVNTLPQFHRWLYSEHQAYACNGTAQVAKIDDVTSKSY